MGFGVSGSFAIIVLASLIAFGTFYGAASNGAERIADAQQAVTDHRLDRINTEINVTAANYDAGNDTLAMAIENTGSTTLSVNRTDVVVDNTYHSSFTVFAVEGNGTTDLWLPGETLEVELTISPAPERIKIVAETGVAASVEV